MEVWVPPEHIPERLVGDNHPGKQRSVRGLVVELTEDVVDQTRHLGEKNGPFATAGRAEIEPLAGKGPDVVVPALRVGTTDPRDALEIVTTR